MGGVWALVFPAGFAELAGHSGGGLAGVFGPATPRAGRVCAFGNRCVAQGKPAGFFPFQEGCLLLLKNAGVVLMDLRLVVWSALDTWKLTFAQGVSVFALFLLLIGLLANLRLNLELFGVTVGLTGLIAAAMWRLGHLQ